MGHPRGPEAAGRQGRSGQPAVPPVRARLPAGDRRAGQRRLPARPERLPERRARPRPLPAGQHPGRLRASTACRSGRGRHGRATARSPTTTCPGSPAAPTSRASSASTTWRTCHEPALERHEPVPRRHPGARRRRPVRLLRLHEGEPVREPVRVQGRLQRREQPEAELAGADRRRGGGQGQEGRAGRPTARAPPR